VGASWRESHPKRRVGGREYKVGGLSFFPAQKFPGHALRVFVRERGRFSGAGPPVVGNPWLGRHPASQGGGGGRKRHLAWVVAPAVFVHRKGGTRRHHQRAKDRGGGDVGGGPFLWETRLGAREQVGSTGRPPPGTGTAALRINAVKGVPKEKNFGTGELQTSYPIRPPLAWTSRHGRGGGPTTGRLRGARGPCRTIHRGPKTPKPVGARGMALRGAKPTPRPVSAGVLTRISCLASEKGPGSGFFRPQGLQPYKPSRPQNPPAPADGPVVGALVNIRTGGAKRKKMRDTGVNPGVAGQTDGRGGRLKTRAFPGLTGVAGAFPKPLGSRAGGASPL